MQSGQIMVGAHEGVYVIKMVGDVRLNLCASFDDFIDSMFQRDDFTDVVFDLHGAECVDSTTLGLMAKIAIRALERGRPKPLALSADEGIRHLLDAMGFESLIEVSDERRDLAETEALKCESPDEYAAREKVLEAHRVLMSMNARNEEAFRDLVHSLELECDPIGKPSARMH
ncbi:STAS domain-containing protein [Microbulbifer thermotolerans]|uniref:STAS domain-containing protein n=1 Tax=Microbulbifer thermotolerans TaxID=252514 RepID=UPI002248BD8B|nr:STAS domain-containing protein [Microbulbifer thermotolerans]MCX2780075.1 STAS domain-containing protein [Microbulbifer thermotolerans]MCX2805499.1 STAS domain-containing protein [Microbulbifer thermotolerans]MCX2831974.1 STAS domain-containing protein [Microbulbifer thermotolerans]